MKHLLCYIILCCFYISVYAQYPKIGDLITNSDGSKGVVFWVSPDGCRGWMVALHDLTPGFWGKANVDVPGLKNITDEKNDYFPALLDTAGYQNTTILRQFQGVGNTYAAQKVDFEHGWYVPAVGQAYKLQLVWSEIKPIVLGNGGADLSEKYYWTSSELSRRLSWIIDTREEVSIGRLDKEHELFRLGIRPIRSFTNTNLSYKWNTGETTPSVTVSPKTTTDYSVKMTSAEGWSTSASQKIVVNPSHIIDLNETISKGGSYDFRGQVLTEAGVYDDSLKTILGCDSIYRLHLTVNSTSQPNITIQATAQEICDGEQVTLSVRKTWAVGDILCTDGTAVKREELARSGKTAKGVVFWISPDETHGWAIHPREVVREWAMAEVDIPGLPNIDCKTLTPATADTAGYQNTKIIREFGTAEEFPAAYAIDFDQGFYLPAAGQVLLMITKMIELNKSLAIVPGANQMNEEIIYKGYRMYELMYWASTEMDKKYAIYGYNLVYTYKPKTMHTRVRGVCRFEIRK